MSNCSSCGAPLRQGAAFCSTCGAPARTDVFCSQCGAKLSSEDQFCFSCGAPVKRGNGAAAQSSNKLKNAYPDVRGFYAKSRVISASDRAVVFVDYDGLYRVDQNLHLYRSQLIATALVQTDDHILALVENRTAEAACLELVTLNDTLGEVSRRTLRRLPPVGAPERYAYTMNEQSLFTVQYRPVDDEQFGEVHADFVFTRIRLTTGEETVIAPTAVQVEGGRLAYFENRRLLSHGGKLYFEGMVQSDGDWEGAVLTLDFDTAVFTQLWKGRGDQGRPRFYDFARGIMWTHPTKAELKAMGTNSEQQNMLQRSALPLVARQIAPSAPIQKDCQVWQAFPTTTGYLDYFDGQKAYYAQDYYHFYAIDPSGAVSESWNNTGHGRSECTVVWRDIIIADLAADYCYTAYPAQFNRPEREQLRLLKEQS